MKKKYKNKSTYMQKKRARGQYKNPGLGLMRLGAKIMLTAILGMFLVMVVVSCSQADDSLVGKWVEPKTDVLIEVRNWMTYRDAKRVSVPERYTTKQTTTTEETIHDEKRSLFSNP